MASAGIDPGDAVPVLVGLATAGVCARAQSSDHWISLQAPAELIRLAVILRGADHYRRLRLEAVSVELAVTMPMAPSRLEPELGSTPGRPGGYLPTHDAFLRVARAAHQRLVVMTPFLDARGFGWLKAVMQTASPATRKVLVLRDADKYAVELGVHQNDWIVGTSIAVCDYHLPHSYGSGRALPVETFHAKILLADDTLAYVGSANVLGSGNGTSLETGVLVAGAAAQQVARLVDAVLRIARTL
ncbi:phospholipase D-like domain-containing protein [Mesorhizobium delmotii]|uniref:PLD phosphodiesterase domain-containing protein n=1 Tax=Mesorhizobium delmotii TaxID=1631247 RepID=A0A2P9AAV9_9HYPH|nr:phospholipase D-like domain-containing protein [Mesorhizobium delmotii]SJM28271.1 hypothetical protein BQ8482_110201 [Mesorhizobium delmotii]